ncbi:MAG: translational GTPase TypA [Bdellovibrionaceae bacterium]|nr:translational GTPase TypA [Bdellovibrionales bacterium]MCB9085042.1 translational GTPase TypA [Pseudobdellovibrionaceae bacterium]
MDIRNLAIIAHVDHGKTTLIDGLFQQAGVFESHQRVEDRVMDSGELEKERGITITAKNASLVWKGTRINLVDTPGHADFGGEVERALFMVDGALLLVDAAEGPLPQTRFVLRKALERGIKIILLINKVDRPDARIEEVEEKVLELFYDVATDESQVEYTTIYASGKHGWATLTKGEQGTDFSPLLDRILEEMPRPSIDENGPFKMIVVNRSYNSFMGQIAIGRIQSGSIKEGQRVQLMGESKNTPFTVTSLETFAGLGTEKVPELNAGDIALIAGADAPKIGDTIAETGVTEALPRVKVDPPTVAIRISVNTSPFSNKDGTYLTSRKLEEILEKACLQNVALSLESTESNEVFLLKARGELQIVIVLEEIRRGGFELMAGRPEILPLEKDGAKWEPEETFFIDIPETMMGRVTEIMSSRGGRLQNIEKFESSSRCRLEFDIPSRGLIGLRSTLLTETRGEAIYSSTFKRYIPYMGKRFSRSTGAIVCDRNGTTTEYALFGLEDRGRLFVAAGTPIYEGMIFGENNRLNDLNANPTKEKKLTNMRASGSDDSTKLSPIKPMSLDEALDWIDEDEWVEITPKSIRVRKMILQTNQRQIIRRPQEEDR